MTPSANITSATSLMAAFAERTGLDSDAAPQRYLWTDAFAVCNFHALAEAGGEARFRELALRTIDQVHRELGQHRGDDTRSGWLQGPNGTADAEHPTRAGLRIGKPLPERGIGEGIDERLEWEREGQYFHYLTRWMHALDQFGAAAANPDANGWARELAATAHRAFTDAPGAPRRMSWKMSIALDRPQVASMGQHDPLDGLVTCLQLHAHRAPGDSGPDLQPALRDFAALVQPGGLATTDPLGLGGLLGDAWRLAQLRIDGTGSLLAAILAGAAAGLSASMRQRPFAGPADRRLAFRELGLAIGLAAVPRLQRALDAGPPAARDGARASLEALAVHLPLARELVAFWRQPAHQRFAAWEAHEDINAVMLATALVPEGYLDFHDTDRDGTDPDGRDPDSTEPDSTDSNGTGGASADLPRR